MSGGVMSSGITNEQLNDWLPGMKFNVLNELKYLIEELQEVQHRLQTDEQNFTFGSAPALRYNQFCQALHQMQTLAKLRQYTPNEAVA
jgi:hypothetical protein